MSDGHGAIEAELRRRLGIPDAARRVIVFGESSHWDPNWLRTSESYFAQYVAPNLEQAVAELRREPRRVYGVECMFFLRMFWDRRPALRGQVRALVNDGRLRLTSSGVTTADTIVPSAEALLRDLLLGQEWLRANGMTAEPRLAYFADSFGVTPALPTLLRSAGFDRTAITRIDGMFFAGADYEPPSAFPRRGSSAERLLVRERSLDVIWRDMHGTEVLCHWNAFTYGQGDMLAHRGVARIYLVPLAVPDRSDAHVARKIASFVAQLAPVSRTPYLFCPIGFDFMAPIPDLVALLDRYNERHFPATGVWAVNAGLDDYLALVEQHRAALPVVELDPNPYWTGFYTARPSLKAQARELVDALLLAERLSLRPGAPDVAPDLAGAWWDAAAANHHDFITGTSPDDVVEVEQRPWLDRAGAAASAAVARLAAGARASAASAALPEWRAAGGAVELRTPHLALTLSARDGGAIRSWRDAAGRARLAGIGNDLVCYRDTGGLWRMGHEFRGGRLAEVARASAHAAQLVVRERRGGLEVACTVTLAGEPVTRRVWVSAASPAVWVRIEGRAADGHTIAARFDTGLAGATVVTGVAGGVAERPRQKIFSPTFWSAQRLVHLRGGDEGLTWALGQPGAAAAGPDGRVELIALRNANRELAFGVIPLPATPATGHERGVSAVEFALLPADAGWRAEGLLALLSPWASPWRAPEEAAAELLAADVVRADAGDVLVTAVKRADRGAGVIVRLEALWPAARAVALSAPGRRVIAAWRCDARERDLALLALRDGAAIVEMAGTIETARLLWEA